MSKLILNNLHMKKLAILILGIVVFASCKKFVDVNDNPNTPTTTRADYIFTNALNQTATNQVGGVHQVAATWTGILAHTTSFTGGGTEKTYQFTNGDFNFFDGMYNNLADYQWVIDNGAEQGYSHLIGPSKIMQAIVFQKLVDLYGDIPYTEALKGSVVASPKYDDDQFIYEDLIKKIDEAIAEIKAATWPPSEAGDIAFHGDETSWIRLGNTVKMRILMRQSFMPGRDAYITTEINKILAEGTGFITDNVYVQPGYTKASGKLNPMYTQLGYNENDVESGTGRFRKSNKVIIDFLKATNDQFRLQRLAYPRVGGNPTNSADYVGIPLGTSGNAYLETLVSSVGSVQIVKGDATRPNVLFSMAEMFFLKAEAAQRYGIAGLGTAEANYKSGVQWAFRLAAATHTSTATASNAQADAAAATYLASGTQWADWAATTDKISLILLQKWLAIAHFDGLEAWSEYRKSTTTADPNGFFPAGYTVKSTVVSASQTEPVRLYYTLRENSVNSANVPQNVNVFTNRVFWDVQ